MHSPSERPIPRPWILFYLLISAAWLLANAVVILRFRMLDSDSIMYGLPLAFAHHPLDLKIPWIGDLESYDNVWGHHWPGGMWLRAALYSLVPFTRVFDVTLLLLAVWGAATLTGHVIWKATGWPWLAATGAFLIMSDRLLVGAPQLHRFEPLGVLAFTAYLAYVIESRENLPKMWVFLGWLAAFILPTVHPFGLPLGGILTLFIVIKAFALRSTTKLQAIGTMIFAAAGMTVLFLWFGMVPGTKDQLEANIALQNTFKRDDYATLWMGLDGYRFQSGRILWVLSTFSCLFTLFGLTKKSQSTLCSNTLRLLPALLFIGHAAFYTITRTANYAYICFGFPVAAILIAISIRGFYDYGLSFCYRTASALFLITVSLFATFTPYRLFQYAKAGFPDLSKIPREILEDIHPGKTVYIPPPMWYAASIDNSHSYKLWTFCVASSSELRKKYERLAYSDIHQGDILIVDNLAGRRGDPYGILPTFNYRNLDPEYWKPIRHIKKLYPGKDLDFGYDFLVYEYQGGDWIAHAMP